jgi:hypothetical protein
MGGGGKSGGASNQQLETSQVSSMDALTALATQQGNNSQTLFNMGLPGLEQSNQFYESLASGDPTKIAQVIAPATQQVSQAATGAKQNIMSEAPAGGEKNLALENVNVAQGAEVGKLASHGYTSAFPALAQLGGGQIGQSQSAAGAAMGGYTGASSIAGNVLGEHNQVKGATQAAWMGVPPGTKGSGGGGSGGGGGQGQGKGGGGGSGNNPYASLSSGGDSSAGFDYGSYSAAGGEAAGMAAEI